MLNQIILVGRLTRELEVKEKEEKKISTLSLAIPRSFKNADGEYDTDFVDCILYDIIAKNTAEYCRKGDIVVVKGRIQSKTIENEDGTKQNKMEIIAEKVTFLSSKKSEEE